MKKSMMVTLVISGALLAGCDDNQNAWGDNQDQVVTNNTYVPGQGYWHAPYSGWYPYPYNSYHPGRGYYHGGFYSAAPHVSSVTSSHLSGSSSHSSSVSRGGFGGSAHS